MKVVRGRALAVIEVADLTDYLALAHLAAAQHAVRVELASGNMCR